MRKTALKSVLNLARVDSRVCFIGSDLGAGTMDDFVKEMPERIFREGISEQHVIGLAAGLALDGKIPYVNTLATFITRRCLEQIILDIALHDAKVRLIGNGGGLVYAPLGPTHVTTDDLGFMRLIPNMAILAPCDAKEMKSLMPTTLDWEGPIYIRLAKGNDQIVSCDHQFIIGKSVSYAEGEKALLICTGICLQICLSASELLKKSNINVGILHMPTIKPLDIDAILSRIPRYKAIITVEEHNISGGLGSAVAEILLESALPILPKFKRIGFPNKFINNYGKQYEHFNFNNITPTGIANEVFNILSIN
jgi:transketolase